MKQIDYLLFRAMYIEMKRWDCKDNSDILCEFLFINKVWKKKKTKEQRRGKRGTKYEKGLSVRVQ